MANTKISQLPVATTLTTGDLLPVVQGGATKQVTLDLLPISTAAAAALAGKDAAGAAAAAQAAAVQRANHTGTQPTSTITGLDTALAAKADLVAGQIPSGQIPALALANTQTVASQAAMLALTATQVQPGDIAVRTDGAGTFILTSTDPTQLANWTRLNAPTDAVTTVNGQNGTVVLAKADVGLGNVDNTADTAKPVSTVQQAALDLKAPLASPAFTGTPTIGGDTATKTADVVAVAYSGTFRGAWAGNIAYNIGDVVTADGGVVRVITAHTSNAAGFTYDRANWEAVPVPGLHGASTVRIRHLDVTNAGATGTTIPAAGVFQRRPKRFNYKAERPLWTAQAAADVTVTGGTVATGTRPLGSALVTCNTSGTTNIVFPARAAFDVTGGFFRVPLTMSDPAGSGRYVEIHLSSDGAFTNYHVGVLLWANNDSPPSGGKVAMYGVPVAEMTVIGTGANLSAITTVRIQSQNVAPALTIDVEQVRWHPNTSDKAKVVLWFDDGGLTNQVAAMKVLAKYGFPATIASIANNLTGSGSTFNGDAARHVQNVYGAQLAVHAYGGNDHNIAQQTGNPILEQLLDYQHFEQAMGFNGGDDLAYWNPGLTQQMPLSDEVTIRKLFRSARTTAGRFPETLPPIDPYRTNANNGSTATAMQAFVTRAIAYKGCAQFLWHAVSAGNLTELTTFAAWLDGQRANVDVVTAAQAFDPLCT